MSGMAIGLAVAIVPACIAWKVRRGELRAYAVLVGVAGAIGGLVVARRKRWSDGEVALFLDARLGSDESIVTALETNDVSDAARGAIVARATSVLASGEPSRAKTRLVKPVQSLGPIAVVALVAIARWPLPVAPVIAPTPGASRVTIAQADGLEKIAKLARVDARDDEQRERLAKIARDASTLKEQLRVGLEKRDAQDRIARMREAIDQERLSLGDGEKRAGLESAVSQLERTAPTRAAARALGDHDLQSMDAEMERVANSREKRDRALADGALKEAADAAKQAGASDVAKALENERALLTKRGERADALRDLAKAMKEAGALSDGAQRSLDSLDRDGSDDSARALAAALGEAWSKLTPEEQKKVAEKMAKLAKGRRAVSPSSGTPPPPPDAKELEEQLRAMANDDSASDEAERESALDGAEQGASETQAALDGQGSGDGNSNGNGNGNGNGNASGSASGDGAGAGAGGSHDFGTGAHHGRTDHVDGDTLKSRAHAAMNAANAMPGSVTTFAPGRAGDVSTAVSTGDLRAAAPSQIDGVDKSDVPEEYREHVRQYFNPRETTR
jgi:hypothetical protein